MQREIKTGWTPIPLKTNDILVKDVFYLMEEAKLGHEYQFIMTTSQAENTFGEMVDFLETSN